MPEDSNEAKDFDSVADEILNKVGDENPADSSSANKSEESESNIAKAAGAEPEKTEQVKAVEDDESLSVEEKIAKIKEIIGNDEKALDAYIKQKGYHNDPAWQKQREIIERLKKESEAKSILSEEDKIALSEFKKFRSSADYIQNSMKAQGYTQEAIDKKLQESGFEVKSSPQDDVKLVVEKLGLNFDNYNPDEKSVIMANISDTAKIFNVLFEDKFGKILPQKLAPIEEKFSSIEKTENSSKIIRSMQEIVKSDNVLDFNKDIEPALNKFLDENPDANQTDVFEYFKQLNHKLTVERLRVGKKKEERDEKKTNLRQNLPFSSGKQALKKSGNFEEDADAFLNSVNI